MSSLEEIGSRVFWGSVSLAVALIILGLFFKLGRRIGGPVGGFTSAVEGMAGVNS